MDDMVVLEWTFSPPDFFEEPVTFLRFDYVVIISNGTVEAKAPLSIYDFNRSIHSDLHQAIEDCFLGVQLLKHRPYQLSYSGMTHRHRDGRRDRFLRVEPGKLTITASTADFQLYDQDGRVRRDSRRERLHRMEDLRELVSRFRPIDRPLDAILHSYDAAVRDPDNELVHLYEIRDALSKRFDGLKGMMTVLEISQKDVSRFGFLCNEAPLRQGRHRGKGGIDLRNATDDELCEARGIASGMIEKYLEFLKRIRG